MIIARDIAIEAGVRRLISHASFTVNSGDKIGLVGPNGAGKTTLLRTLAGELEPEEGSIVRAKVIGYLSQEAALVELADDEVTALERILKARSIGELERRMEDTRAAMENRLADLGFQVTPSQANFVWCKHESHDTRDLYEQLKRQQKPLVV